MGLFDFFKRGNDSKADLQRAGARMQRARINSNAPTPRVNLGLFEMAELYRYNRLVRRIVDIQAKAAARDIPQFSGANADDWTKLFKDLKLMSAFRDGLTWGLTFGLGVAVLNFDDRLDLSQPLQIKRASKLVGYTVYDKRTILPLDPAAGAQSEFYQIMSASQAIGKVHRSRLLIFDGERLDQLSRINNGGCGESLLNQLSNAIAAVTGGWENSAYVLEVFSMLTYAIDDFDNLMATQARAVTAKIDTLDLWRHVSRIFAFDKKDMLDYKSMNLSNFDKVFEIILERVSIESGVPLVYLIGRSAAGGMGENGRSEREQFTGLVEDLRSDKIDDNLNYLLSLLSVVYGFPEPEYGYGPVVPPDPERWAKIKQLTAATDAANINAGIYGAKTAQQRYKGEFSTDITVHPDEDLELIDELIGDPDDLPDDTPPAADPEKEDEDQESPVNA